MPAAPITAPHSPPPPPSPGWAGRPPPASRASRPTLVYYAGTTAAGTPLSGAPIAAGTYTVVARFPGSADYSAVQSARGPIHDRAGQRDDRAARRRAARRSTGSPSRLSRRWQLSVPTDGTPTGTVTFFDGATPLATVSLDSSGRAGLTTSVLAVGSHSITATYNGKPRLPRRRVGRAQSRPRGGNQLSASESVAKAGTEVVLVPQPVLKKKQVVSVRLTAEIEPIAPGGGVPTGAVTFEMFKKGKGKKTKTKEEVLGTATLDGGQATLKVKANQVLNKSITIAYAGDADFASSTATPPPLTQHAFKSLARPMVALIIAAACVADRPITRGPPDHGISRHSIHL